jgi:hypothetical protein
MISHGYSGIIPDLLVYENSDPAGFWIPGLTSLIDLHREFFLHSLDLGDLALP